LKYQLYQLEGFQEVVQSETDFRALAETFQFDIVRAGIIWREYPVYSNRILLNAGENSGVRKNSAAVTPNGIVGRVIVTTLFSAEVELLTDVNGAAGVYLAESGIQGVVQGEGTNRLLLRFIPLAEKVEPGEMLFTSGSDRIYPRGLPVGTVHSVAEEGTYKTLIVEPSVDFERLADVAVVVSNH
jgi:rod shape-determining protein MreC